jgi:hypothetical protein
VSVQGLDLGARLLVDTNLLVLFAVGSVNRNRIETFKRTRQYANSDYDLLVKVIGNRILYTVAHVMAEVSNLTDLNPPELLQVRRVLAKTISVIQEPHVSSAKASETLLYENLGLADSAISIVAREQKMFCVDR